LAQPPAPSDAFLREVDDELRRDQLAAAWRRWGRIGIVAVVVGLLLFAGWLYWNNRVTERAGVEAEQLKTAYEGLAGGDRVEAEATLSRLAESDRDGHRALAQLAQADQLLAAQDAKGAAAKFAVVAADTSLGQPFRDLALLRQTLIEYDTLAPQTVVERLRPLATPGNAWFPTAAELTAVAYARQGRRDLAGRLFGQIARQENAPETTRQRAVQMASAMGVDAAPAPSPNPGVTPQP
jgi:hypothetical protein